MSESNQEEIDELVSNLESETTEQTPIQPTGGTNTNLTVPSMADRTFCGDKTELPDEGSEPEEEVDLIRYFNEKIRVLDANILAAEKDEGMDTKKDILLRQLRHKRRQRMNDRREALERKSEREYKESYMEEIRRKKEKKQKKIDKIFKDEEDTLKPTDTNTPTYNRNLNMIGKYKESIRSLRTEVNKIMDEDISGMTEQAITQMELASQAKINTIKLFTKEYEKHHHDVIMVGNQDTIASLVESFQEIMEIQGTLEAQQKLREENKKKQLALSKAETLESIKLEKFTGQGEGRYLKYYIWYTEFSELVMNKEYSDSVKLKLLKQYTDKDALDLIKNYHHPQEITTAFKTLDEHYGKPSMVIRESLKNLRHMETVKSIYDIKANRGLLSKINTNISTLKCYNFDLEGEDVENSSFLIEMEEKIPHLIYTKWEEEKVRLKNNNEDITIDNFIQFYTNIINIEEKAQYLRRQNRSDDRGQPQVPPRTPRRTLNLYQTNVRPTQNTNQQRGRKFNRTANKPQGNFKGTFKGQWNHQANSAGGNLPKNMPRYCIFCETNTHDTAFCRIERYTAEYKTKQCQKHNACYMCFKTSEHKASTCPRIMKCYLCPKMHHFNNHPRKEIDEYYKKKKKDKPTQ